jgi:hypothetical protein
MRGCRLRSRENVLHRSYPIKAASRRSRPCSTAAGRTAVRPLVTQEIGLGDINEAYVALKKGGIIRSVITSF